MPAPQRRQVQFAFDAASHKYLVDEQEIPSVTTIMDEVCSKRTAYARAAMVASRAQSLGEMLDAGESVIDLDTGEAISPLTFLKNAEWLRNEVGVQLGRAAGRGTVTHLFLEAWGREECTDFTDVPHWVENTVTDRRIDCDVDETTGYCLALLGWLGENDVRVLATETPVVNFTLDYIGTADGWVAVGDEVWLIDIKTSKGSSITHGYQLAAYLNAEYSIAGGQGICDLEVPPVPDRLVNLLVQHGSVRPREWTKKQIPELFAGFTACKQVYDQTSGVNPTTIKNHVYKEI